jgi:hypothetical protein
MAGRAVLSSFAFTNAPGCRSALGEMWGSRTGFRFPPNALTENGRKIAGSVEDSNDLERFPFRIVNDQVARVGLYNPEAKGQGS